MPRHDWMTWTVTNFDPPAFGRSEWTSAVVTAENVEMAIIWLEKELERIGAPQKIKPEQLIPMVTHGRKVRILCDGLIHNE